MKEKDMTILIIGSGGREHAISCAYEKSQKVKKIIVAPGNDFISFKRRKDVTCDNNCSQKDPESILKIAKKYAPDLIEVAQDDALAAGTVNLLQKEGFQVFGPTQESSRIEWDKKWSREFMQRHDIPSPKFKYFKSEERALGYVEGLYQDKNKIVYVKAAGLCEGKGALKATNLNDALKAVKQMKNFGPAGNVFLIEEALKGEEFSYYIISDGKNYQVFKSAQDNKTVFNFDLGPQTGGMGAISPAKITEPITNKIEEEQIKKAIDGMNQEGIPYKGILYLGGIVNENKIMNIEYNARWGDPECQAILPSLETDYVDIVLATINGNVNSVLIRQDNKIRMCVIGVSKGYPVDYSKSKGKRIYGLEEAMEENGIQVFGAGVKMENEKFYTNGGRLFSIVAEGDTLLEAKEKAYGVIAKITIEGNNLEYRTDIGWRDIERELGIVDKSKTKSLKKYQETNIEDSEEEDWATLQKDEDNENNGENYWVTEGDIEPTDPNEVRFQEATLEEEEFF